MIGRKIIVGDVHGCITELRWLIKSLNVDGDDHVTFLGDIIDKGPASGEVVQFIRDMKCEKTLLMGNHEERFLRFCSYEFSGKGESNPMKHIPEEFYQHIVEMSMDNVMWLDRTMQLTHQFEHMGERFICTHGGILPHAQTVPSRSDKRKKINPWLRLRYVSPSSHFVRLGKETPGDKYWAELYAGQFGTALFGHQPFMDCDDPFNIFDHAIPLDGGCVHGGELRALVLTPGSTEARVQRVTALRRYADVYKPT